MNYSEIDILNFVEGRFDDQQTAQILAQLRIDPELAAAVETMQASQVPIAQAYELESTPPIPHTLRSRINALASASQPQPNETEQNSLANTLATDNNKTTPSVEGAINRETKTRSGKLTAIGLAACLVSGVGIGALMMKAYLQQNPSQTNSASNGLEAERLSVTLKHARWVKRIADYQSLYVENTVASVSQSAIDDALKLLESTDNLGDTQASIPDFSELGYQFARAQELGFEGQTLVQFVYKKSGSAPLALCFMRDSNAQPIPMNLSEHHGLNAASWVTGNQHYVLVAEESDAFMKQLYEATSDVL